MIALRGPYFNLNGAFLISDTSRVRSPEVSLRRGSQTLHPSPRRHDDLATFFWKNYGLYLFEFWNWNSGPKCFDRFLTSFQHPVPRAEQRHLSTEKVSIWPTDMSFPHVPQGCESNPYCHWDLALLRYRKALLSMLSSQAGVERAEFIGSVFTWE